jgi:hypothetical protein
VLCNGEAVVGCRTCTQVSHVYGRHIVVCQITHSVGRWWNDGLHGTSVVKMKRAQDGQ